MSPWPQVHSTVKFQTVYAASHRSISPAPSFVEARDVSTSVGHTGHRMRVLSRDFIHIGKYNSMRLLSFFMHSTAQPNVLWYSVHSGT